MARARGRLIVLASVFVLLTIYAVASAGQLVHISEAGSECVWTLDKQAFITRLFRSIYGDSVSKYVIDSVKLINYEEVPLFCTYRLVLKNKITGTEISFDIYEMFGRIKGFRIYLPPAEPLSTVDIGEVVSGDVFRITPRALREIDDIIGKIREVFNVPSLEGAVISLSNASPPEGLYLKESGLSRDDVEQLFSRGEAVLDLGNGLTADLVYIWNRYGMDRLTVYIFKNFTVGPGAYVKFPVMIIQFYKLRGEWVTYDVSIVPFKLMFDRVSNPPSAFLQRAEEAALEEYGPSCRVTSASFTEAWAPGTPRYVNGSIYRPSVTYVYDITLDCGGRTRLVRVLVNALNGEVYSVSAIDLRGPGPGYSPLETGPMFLVVPVSVASVAALAYALLRRRGSSR